MTWDATQFLTDLGTAVDRFDHARAAALCDELIAHVDDGDAVDPSVGRKTLATLRRKRYFDVMERVAEAFRTAGIDDDQIRRQYAQALIDQGYMSAAAYVLELLLQTAADPEEKAEASGLLGRIAKQLYVNAVNADPADSVKPAQRRNLDRAVGAYAPVYRSNPACYLWHGINTVALVERARRDGVPLAHAIDSAAIAREILAAIEAMPRTDTSPQHWDLATAAEASLALGKVDDAVAWIGRYVLRSSADAFELSSTERQLREVWGLTLDQPPGSVLLPMLQAGILGRSGGAVRLSPAAVPETIACTREAAASPKLERILGTDGTVSLGWFLMGLERAKSVAQIRQPTGEGWGTGFLFRGGDIAPGLGDELVLITNAHVVSHDPEVQKNGALAPEDAIVVFEAHETAKGQQFRVQELWSSPPKDLDATLLRLTPSIVGTCGAPIATGLPVLDGTQRVYVIGHPGGRGLSFSLQDNLLLGYDDRLLHYRAPTEGGSSGSPVFNQQWKWIGLHHAGGFGLQKLDGKGGTEDANEGIQIRRIAEAIRSSDLH